MIVLKINSLTIEVLANVVLAQPDKEISTCMHMQNIHSLCNNVEVNAGKLNHVTLSDKKTFKTIYQCQLIWYMFGLKFSN